jgi:hypothetical protein
LVAIEPYRDAFVWWYVASMTGTELHRLVDESPDESIDAAGILLARARDPLVARLEAAPVDDEPCTADDQAASDGGWSAHRRGESVELNDLRP